MMHEIQRYIGAMAGLPPRGADQLLIVFLR